MVVSPGRLTLTLRQAVVLGLAAIALALGGFEAGRQTVDAAAIVSTNGSGPNAQARDLGSSKQTTIQSQIDRVRVREIATVPFSELYDILKATTREQLLAWAADLEQMPRGPRQCAAVAAYYKSLVQVNHRVAIDAVLRAKNLNMRDVAIDAMMKAAPESIWAELGEMTAQLPYPDRGFAHDNLIPNWSKVDPVAASHFVEKHRFSLGTRLPGEESDRAVSLLNNWGEIDPSAAKKWLEADAGRQTSETFRAFLTSWGRVDRAAAIDYAIANDRRPNFQPAINELVHDCVRSAKEDASRLLLLLPPEAAKAALKNVADVTNPHEIDSSIEHPLNYQQPADQVARWMVTLPLELWEESIGRVTEGWLNEDADSAKEWLAQLQPEQRDVTIVSLCGEAKAHQIATRHVIELGLTISDPKLRDATLTKFVRSLGSTTEEALEVLGDVSVSAAQRAYLRKIMTESGNGQ